MLAVAVFWQAAIILLLKPELSVMVGLSGMVTKIRPSVTGHTLLVLLTVRAIMSTCPEKLGLQVRIPVRGSIVPALVLLIAQVMVSVADKLESKLVIAPAVSAGQVGREFPAPDEATKISTKLAGPCGIVTV
jgi:hypothetical protein